MAIPESHLAILAAPFLAASLTLPLSPEFRCTMAGVFGGCLVLAATADKRKPTLFAVTADIMSAAGMGFFVPAFGIAATLKVLSIVPGWGGLAKLEISGDAHRSAMLWLAGVSGIAGIWLARTWLPKLFPTWFEHDPTTK